jgi:hypothetical protein
MISTPINSVEKIDVDELIKDFKVLNLGSFSNYLKEIWRDLTQRSDSKSKGINKLTFSKVKIINYKHHLVL